MRSSKTLIAGLIAADWPENHHPARDREGVEHPQGLAAAGYCTLSSPYVRVPRSADAAGIWERQIGAALLQFADMSIHADLLSAGERVAAAPNSSVSTGHSM